MAKQIIRAALGAVFGFVFLVLLLVAALNFRMLSPGFWKTSLDEAKVYQLLREKVEVMQAQLTQMARKQAGGRALPKDLVGLLSVADELTTQRLKELVETNIDRLLGYMTGKQSELVLFLPVTEWKLPVAVLRQPALAKLDAQTPLVEALTAVGYQKQQIDNVTKVVVQSRQVVGWLPLVLVSLTLVAVGLLLAHYWLGVGPDRLLGTGWLLAISGFSAQGIGLVAGQFFELVTSNAKPPMALWVATLVRSLLSQFFQLGTTIGLVVGIAGLVLVAGVYLFDKREKPRFKIRPFVLGTILGLVVVLGLVLLLLVPLGGQLNLTIRRQ